MTDEYPYDDMFSLQPLVDRVTVEKKVFDTLQKNNMDLMEKLNKAKEALRFYADPDCFVREKVKGELAYKTLQEIEK